MTVLYSRPGLQINESWKQVLGLCATRVRTFSNKWTVQLGVVAKHTNTLACYLFLSHLIAPTTHLPTRRNDADSCQNHSYSCAVGAIHSYITPPYCLFQPLPLVTSTTTSLDSFVAIGFAFSEHSIQSQWHSGRRFVHLTAYRT